MDILEAIHGRRAVRDFEDRPVVEPTLRALIEAATWAPSGMNRQPWCFHVAEGRKALAPAGARRPPNIRFVDRAY